jgi:hypothetical protein
MVPLIPSGLPPPEKPVLQLIGNAETAKNRCGIILSPKLDELYKIKKE